MSLADKMVEQEMPAIEFDVEMNDANAKPIDCVFVCEKDSKSVLVYRLNENSHERRPIDMDSNFLHNF